MPRWCHGLVATSALALWRDPGDRLVPVIRVAALAVAACSVAIVALGSSIGPGMGSEAVALLVAAAIGAGGRTVLRTAVMELVHRRVDTTNSVRVMTLIDVVGSTSFQIGAFAAGLLIAASTGASGPVDPYRTWLLVTAAALLVVAARFRPLARG